MDVFVGATFAGAQGWFVMMTPFYGEAGRDWQTVEAREWGRDRGGEGQTRIGIWRRRSGERWGAAQEDQR